uniref:URB1 ribosome biogenesis homolog n=1 Tax=Mastacembelus armatus TaxID=205130 RepID=A0A3Q3S3N5_9TELE
MSKKRRGEDSSEPNTPVKKEKVPEFNGTVFKAMLKEPTTAMKGESLGAFISTAKKLPCSDLYDVVEGYIKISMECAEIFKLLEGEKHLESEMMLIFESLEMILLRTASDLSHFNMVGNAIVKKMVSSHMKLLQGSFHSQNHRLCISLLSALVSQGPEAAREVLSHIHINKALSGLVKRKDKRGRPDVRMTFIQFVLSFLVSGDNATVGQILESKELLPEILSTGVKEDRLSIVSLILSTLKTRVVLNKAISKTQKVRFFTPAVLANIASLYKWNGTVDATTDDNRNSEHAGISVVRELVHSFLIDLCCSRKHGISFHDASFGTAGRAGNIVLLQFLVGLKQATDDELVADLVVNVLKASPDILARYFKETQYSYTPRLKSAWQDNVKLLRRIYEAQPEFSTIFRTLEVIPLPRLLSVITVTSVPPVCNKAFFTQGLNLANTAVQFTTFSMMNFILKRANKNIEYLLDKSVWHNSDVYTHDMMEELVQQYRETLSKILPDMMSIVSTWQLLSRKDKGSGQENKTKAERAADQADNKKDMPAEVILLKALILQVICLYQKVVPHLVNQCKFDFSKLLKSIMSEKGIREEVPPVLQYHILQLALDLPASKFSWFRIQDVADTESLSGEKSVLYLLLMMFVSTSSTHLKTSTQMLILKVLKDTGVFEYTWTELELWLNQLARIEPNQQETVIQFLERVLVKLLCSSYTYTDKVASLVQDAAFLQANLNSQEGDAASIPVSHIDDVLDMLDVIMEGNNGEMEEFGPSLSEDLIIQTFPFSVLVPAALEARNKLSADKGKALNIKSNVYLSAVLSDVLHCQREPLPLCLALMQYDKELFLVQLRDYLTISMTTSPVSLTALMKDAYSQGPSALLKGTFRENMEGFLASMLLTDFPVVIKQILLYIKSTVEKFGSVLLKTFMGILQDLVTKLQGFQETTESEPPAENSEDGSDLFLELRQSPTVEILVSTLRSIFKHPCLEQWFLALELDTLPPQTLNPVRLKHLCAQLSDDILALLKTSAPTLCDMGHLEFLESYMTGIEKAVLKELMEKCSQVVKKQSRPFQALLSLHSYMDSCNVREVVSKLLLLPCESLILPGREATQAQLSVYGHAALQILTEYKSKPQDHNIFLTQAHFHGLGTLLLSCSNPALEAFLLQTLSSEPGSAKLLHTDVLLHCLHWPRPDTQGIGCLLLQNSSTHRLCFEMWCLQPANRQTILAQIETFLPLISTYLQMASREDPARPKDGLYKKVHSFLKGHSFSSLIKLSANITDIRDLVNTLPNEQETWRKSVITAALKCLIASYSRSKDQATSPSEQEQSILERLQQLLVNITASEWNGFVKNGLKYRYRDHHFLHTLRGLLDLMYSGGEVQKDLIPLSTLHMMSSSHSLFLPTMLEPDEEPSRFQAKEGLVSLLLCLVKKCPTVCNIDHFVVLLGAYGATLNTTDQKLLQLLQEYERNHVSLLKFQSFLWGPAAVEHHKTRKSLGSSLWKQASSDELLALLKPDRMLQTIAHFPQHHRIIPQDLGKLYDPCFLLPLFSAILRPECVIDCLKFVSSHALGVTVMALSSYDPQVRAAAYHVLSCFYQHLEGARFREKRQLLYLMDTVKNGIRKQNQRLPFVLTTYITKVAQQMLKPEDHMYVVLNRFLLSHQSLDFRRVPEFFKLFYGFDLEHKVEREWILSVLEEGINDGHCYELCDQQGIFQILLGFSSSPLCDEHSQAQIIRVLCQAARVPKAANNLTKSCGVLTWIIQVVEKRNLDQQLLSAIIDLLHVLWFTNLGQKEKHQGNGAKTTSSTEEKPQSSVKCLPLPLINEFLCVALTISRHLRLGLKPSQLRLFLQSFCSALKHRETALNENKQAGRFTLHPQPLSCTEALSLLLCWASIMQIILHIYNGINIVLYFSGMRKDKARSKGSFFQARTQKETLAEDTEDAKQEERLLAECKFYLRSIFIHWEPVFHVSESQSVQSRDKLDPSQLACDTAHLLTKWSLRCLVEDSYDVNRTKEFMHWVEKAVIKHKEIVDVVLLDPCVKADLLQLYHQAFEAQCQPSISSRVETLQQFTNIMISLLETKSHLPELHQTVISACLPKATHDPSKSGKSLPLYLQTLAYSSKHKRQKESLPTQSAIRAICVDILTMKS